MFFASGNLYDVEIGAIDVMLGIACLPLLITILPFKLIAWWVNK